MYNPVSICKYPAYQEIRDTEMTPNACLSAQTWSHVQPLAGEIAPVCSLAQGTTNAKVVTKMLLTSWHAFGEMTKRYACWAADDVFATCPTSLRNINIALNGHTSSKYDNHGERICVPAFHVSRVLLMTMQGWKPLALNATALAQCQMEGEVKKFSDHYWFTSSWEYKFKRPCFV